MIKKSLEESITVNETIIYFITVGTFSINIVRETCPAHLQWGLNLVNCGGVYSELYTTRTTHVSFARGA